MVISEARLAANRRNALRSTGPKTEEGKARSRANALKHGLCAKIVVPEDIKLIQERTVQVFDSLKPQDPWQAWLVDQVALASIRVDRSQRVERRVRDKISLRAEWNWDDDRKLEAEDKARSLVKEPAATVEALRRTPQGCEWLMTRWALLAHAAETTGAWTDEQIRLAFDLLATPHAFRTGLKPGIWLDYEGNVVEPITDLAAVARREVAELRARREVVAGLDEVERALTESDLTNEGDPELRRLRRYEANLHARIRWCLKQLQTKTADLRYRQDLRPDWVVNPEPAPKPEPKSADEVAAEGWTPAEISPPFDLEPDEFPEPGQVADVPKILQSRKQKRVKKAEARREGRRQKLDRLRA